LHICSHLFLRAFHANSSDKDEANVLVGASLAPSVHQRGDTDSFFHVDGRDDSNTQDSNNYSGDTNYQESDNAISSHGFQNLSDDDGEELDIGKDFA
jgi:hypothetical protein